jgi:predicted TIM-barrel fold metal-dependent hydrolase
MLIDINANIGHWPFQQTNCNTAEALLERMDEFGIDVSVLSNMNGIFYKDTQASNEELHEEIRSEGRFRDRLIPFAIINPIYAGWKRDLDICVSKMGIKGIRLYPLYHDYEPTHPSCIELVKMARDYGLVVAFPLRMVDSRSRSWMDIDREWKLEDVIPIIKEVPDARYLVLNIANGIHLNDEDTELYKNSDVVFDTSGRNVYNLSELINKFGKDKFALGTHSPILDYVTGLLRVESLRAGEADEATKELLRSGNAQRILGI